MESGNQKEANKQDFKLDDQIRNNFSTLPHEVVLDILCRLPIKFIIQFKSVCKSGNEISRDPELVRLQLSQAVKNDPCFIFHFDYPIKNQLYYMELSDHEDKGLVSKVLNLPFSTSMSEFNLVGSCNGLLCLYDSSLNDRFVLHNPFTGDYKTLPKFVEFEEQEVVYGFGFHPFTKEYKVIKIVYYTNSSKHRNVKVWMLSRSDVQIFSLSSGQWRSIGEVPYFLDPKSPGVLVNGRLHWLSKTRLGNGHFDRNIVSLGLDDEIFGQVPRPNFRFNQLDTSDYHLAVLGGCLSSVLVNRGVNGWLGIWVMKEYSVKESWMMMFSVKPYAPRSFNDGKIFHSGKSPRFLCMLKNGEILLEYNGGSLVSYDPESGDFRNLMVQAMSSRVQTLVHVGTLTWINFL